MKKPKRELSDRQLEALKRGAYKPGQSGNPKGKPAIPEDVKEAAKAHTLTAINTLVDIMLNGKNDASRVNASVAVLNRGWGAPKQTMDVDVNHKQDWSALLTALDAHNAAKALSQASEEPLVFEGVVEAQLLESRPEAYADEGQRNEQ